jgi:hypothetical protein
MLNHFLYCLLGIALVIGFLFGFGLVIYLMVHGNAPYVFLSIIVIGVGCGIGEMIKSNRE